ncbi:hypothetical protein GCM10022239_15180 [Leifsonia bigeumensis]|uniref:Ricin B lectin domain-containing protein n=1 Tax=Leifsonella bigeumensis TaxID=433643 RepID=A0ABP7FIB3_9MICO
MGTQRMRTRSSARRRRRATRRGLIAGITTFLLLAGSGISYAACTAGAAATSTASAASLTITTAGFDSNAFVFQNHLMTTTGSVTVANDTDTTSTTPGTFELSLGYTGSAVLASRLTVTVWPTTDASGCAGVATPPSGAVTGRWDTVATTASPIVGTLVAGSAQGYCLRVTAAERGDLASATGALAIQPNISAILKVGNWSRSTGASTTQTTAWIFPAYGPTPNTWYQIRNLGTDNCVDVYGASTVPGTGVIDYACKTGDVSDGYNQQWKFTRASGDYYDITPRHEQTIRMDVTGGSTATLAAVDVQTALTARLSQEWQLQLRATDVYQLVNRASGLCLQVNDTSVYGPEAEYAQAVCDGSVGQSYSLTQVAVDVPSIALACSSAAGGGVTFSWSGDAIDTYDFQVKPSTDSIWSGVGDVATGVTAITILPAAITGADGQYDVRALWLANLLTAGGVNLWKTAGALSCTAPAPVSMTCEGDGVSAERTVHFTFSSTPAEYRLQIDTGGSTWQDLNGGAYYTGTSAVISGNPPFDLGNGAYPVRAITSAGIVVATSGLRVRTGGASGPYHYLDCR